MDSDLGAQAVVSALVLVGIVLACYYGIAGAVKKGVRDASTAPRPIDPWESEWLNRSGDQPEEKHEHHHPFL